MNIIEPYAKIIRLDGYPPVQSLKEDFGINILQFIESVGRVSHRSEDAQTKDSWKRFIESVVIQHGDWSITEHANVTVEAVVDRGITHEWVRHRLGAYTQESTRFVNYNKKIGLSFVYPLRENPYPNEGPGSWIESMCKAEDSYTDLIEGGWTPQQARSVLPNALASKLIVTYNLRMWRHFFLMRTTKESHPQMRQVTIPLLAEFKSCIPLLYDDIEPEARQADNLRKAR